MFVKDKQKKILLSSLSILNVLICFIFFLPLKVLADKPAKFSQKWSLGGDLELAFYSDKEFNYTKKNSIQLAAHLPGLKHVTDLNDKSFININHIYTKNAPLQLVQDGSDIKIYSDWNNFFSEDFVHLLYGASRLNWLKNKIFPVHAACIGNEKIGYFLLIGASGSGKTSMTLHNSINNGLKIFSADKTLVRFDKKDGLVAISGTHSITIKSNDLKRWASVEKLYENKFGDRITFQLPSYYYSNFKQVPIKRIFFINLNEGSDIDIQLSSLSAFHELYPFFLDKQREDILLGADQDIFNGAISKKLKKTLASNLYKALQSVSIYKISGSISKMSSFIRKKLDSDFYQKKIMFGICGIGSGHYYRQFPLLKYLLDKGHHIVVFTYGEVLNFFKRDFNKHPRLTVIPVANPYYVGTPIGLNFYETALHKKNNLDFFNINTLAIHKVSEQFNRLDLIISDYEMVSAMYAYTKQIPLITLDQQSKFLIGKFPKSLNNTTCLDEIERLSLFFPKAFMRFAISFFKVYKKQNNKNYNVKILPPVIRQNLISAKENGLQKKPSILVYFTAQQFNEKLLIDKWLELLSSTLPSNLEAHIFLPQKFSLPEIQNPNLYFYNHGDIRFDSVLLSSRGIISTAGHTLLSEAMYLEIPVYAIPLPLYEQQLNAHIISEGNFGISEEQLTKESLLTFINNLNIYAKNIQEDKKYLIKEVGNNIIIEKFNKLLEGV